MAAQTYSPSLESLSTDITKYVDAITNFLKSSNLPEPSFDKHGPAIFPPPESPPEIIGARIALVQAATDLLQLAQGPMDVIFGIVGTVRAFIPTSIIVALRAINAFNIPEAVPLAGEASFTSIAEKTGKDPEYISRIIRYAATGRIFRENRPGYVVHTATSRYLLEDKTIRSTITHNLDDMWPMSIKANEALQKYGYSAEPTETAFNVAFDYPGTFWEWIARPENEARSLAFNTAMTSLTKGPFDPFWMAQSPLWATLKPEAIVVDVGGSTGHVSKALAKEYTNLKFVIQDLPNVIDEVQTQLPASMHSQIAFSKHDFMRPQPIAADVYILRFILHDWSDKYAAEILKNIVVALQPGARIAIMEMILPPLDAIPKVLEKFTRLADFQMMGFANAKERSIEQWEALLAKTDQRLKIYDVTSPLGSAISIIVVGLEEEN